MVNSSSYDDLSSQHQTQDRNAKAEFKHPFNVSSESKHPSSSCNKGFSETADTELPSDAFAIEPIPTKTEFNCDMSNENNQDIDEKPEKLQVFVLNDDLNASICCSVPLNKVQGVLTRFHQSKSDEDTPKSKTTRKQLCLYCERSFVSVNLRQKHVERVHSVKQNRRVSSRRQNQQLTVTPCVYCDKLNSTEKTLKDLFYHLVNEHSNKYFGCLPCEQRFLTNSHLTNHNTLKHELPIPDTTPKLQASSTNTSRTNLKSLPDENLIQTEESTTQEIPVKVTRSKTKPKSEEPADSETQKIKKFVTKKKSVKLKELMNKKLSVKSSRITVKRRESKRIQAIGKLTETPKRKRSKPSEKKSTSVKSKPEQSDSTNTTEKSSKLVPTCINPYPEFDCFYRVKKITDHSIDNLKISSLTFDDVFDKAFFNRIKCNIEENLLHHVDGKLFKNEESESRISNFEKISNFPQETQNASSENYGCEISLNAVTPVASLSINSQFGEDFESQIEYGSKPSKKKNHIKSDEVVHYKYFTRRKFQASILQHKENRDLSKLDMWTQLIIKKRQQKMLDEKKSAKEIQEYTTGDEYKSRIKREELNRILDRRGPFEDLKEEASKKVALDKLNSDSEDSISHESFSEVREVLNEILNRVYETTECVEKTVEEVVEKTVSVRIDVREIPSYLNLRRSSSFSNDEIDRSDKITLICSSQETENFELPTNQVRGKNEIVELSGEWARCRMYICAACGAKLPNMKYLMEHKSLYHQNVWVQHYEFVGNQSELYRHLSIPALGKVGAVEESVQCKVWKRSDARICTKCGKQCNALGELHRHILECGGDWTWMLARKKCKYRPFGAKSRRKRRGLIHRVHIKRKTEPTEKKKYKKTFEGPRQRPSDADSIQRMLANLPAKRSTRKLISLQDGIYRARKKTSINTPLNKKNKVKCGKVIYKSQNIKETTEKTLNTTRVNLSTISQKTGSSTNRRTLRSLNKVLASRIIDSNPQLTVKRKLRVINEKRRTRQCEVATQVENEIPSKINSFSKSTNSQKIIPEDESLEKRSSLRSQGKSMKKLSMKQLLTGKINIKSFFPIKKRKNKIIVTELETEPETSEDVITRSKIKMQDVEVPKTDDINTNLEKNIGIDIKKEPKIKKDTFRNLVKSFSMRRKDINKVKEKNNSYKSDKDSINKDNSFGKGAFTDRKCVNEDNTNKKRKLKQNFRNVINRVKKLKIDSEIPSSSTILPREALNIQEENQISQKDSFLDKIKQNDKLDPYARPEKIVIPSIQETRKNSADISETAPIVIKFNETENNPHNPERIFRLESNNEKSLQAKGELNFDTQPDSKPSEQISCLSLAIDNDLPGLTPQVPDMQPICIETSIKPKVVPLISPNMKGKIRKPARGLNDCIAMLTSKLQQKSEKKNDFKNKTCNKTESCSNLIHSPNIFRPFTELSIPKPDCILKIPNFKTQYSGMEETALDLSMKSVSNPELNRKHQHETFWQTRKPNFLLPVEYTQSIWISPTPLLKPNSVEQTIEEVIEKGYRKQNEHENVLKSQIRWNSVDKIIQNVIDGYKDISVETKDKKVSNARNTVDDIIEFVITSSTIDDEENGKKHLVKDDEEIYTDIGIGSKNKFSVSNQVKSDNEFNKYEHNVHMKEDKESLSILPQDEILCSNNLKTPKKRTRRKTNGKINSKIFSLKNQEKPLHAEEGKSTKSENLIANVELILDDDNGTALIDNSNKLTKNKEPKVSEMGENIDKIQDHCSLDTAFIDISGNKIIGYNVNSKKIRKIGQVRNNLLNKKATKGKVLETNIDSLLHFEEVSKSNVLITNLGIVSTGELEKPEIKLTTEDEPHVLEKKALFKKNKIIPSDSEDEIPLSVLRRTENLINTDDNNRIEELFKKVEKDLQESDSKIIEEINSKNNKNDERTINQDIETISTNSVGKDETDMNIEAVFALEDPVQLNETHSTEDITLGIFADDSEKVLARVSENDEKFKDKNEILDINLCKKTKVISAQTTKIIPNGKINSDQEIEYKTKSIENNKVDDIKISNEEVSSPENADGDTDKCGSRIYEPPSKSITNMSMVVFKTPRKVKRFTRKYGSKKRPLSRKMKLNEFPKSSIFFGDLNTTENSEADTDDESLLSIKMSLNLKQNIKELIPDSKKVVETSVKENSRNRTNDIVTVIENTLLVNCTEKPLSTNKTSTEVFPFSDQNKSNGTISYTSLSEIGKVQIKNVSIHPEEKSIVSIQQNDSSLVFDKSDANNFFDSGISDESLENMDQREKMVSVPKRKAKKTKSIRAIPKSSQVSIKDPTDDFHKDDSILNDGNSFMTCDRSIHNDDLKGTTQSDLIRKRSSRSRKRNSEMELSDSSNSIFDISNDKTSEGQNIYDGESTLPSSPTLLVRKQNTILLTENKTDSTNINNSVENKNAETHLTNMKIGMISDVTVIIDNKKELDDLVSIAQIDRNSENRLNLNNKKITKTKIRNCKTSFRKRTSKNRKTKLKKSVLTKNFKNMGKDISNNLNMVSSVQTELVSEKMKEDDEKQFTEEDLDNDLETKIKKCTTDSSSSSFKSEIMDTDPSIRQAEANQNILRSTTKIIRRSMSLKYSKITPNNSLFKRSSSVSSVDSSKVKTTSASSDKSIEDTDASTVRKSRNSLRRSGKLPLLELSTIVGKSDETYVETTENMIDSDLSGRRSRSARNKVINYAENDYNEIRDTSTQQDMSSECASEKVKSQIEISSQNKPSSIETKLKISNDSLEVKLEKDSSVVNLSPNEESNALNKSNTLITKHKLRKRTKRKEKVLRKKRNNEKINKQYTQKNSNEVSESSPIIEDFVQTSKEISLKCSIKASSETTDNFSNYVKSTENISDSMDTLEKTPENDLNLTVTNTPNVTNDTPHIIREPPIKIIINKQKTRRKSKSFRKTDTKNQNDLFKDFALVIKKPKRLAPIITFTPSDSILKETYPNLVTTLAEPSVESEQRVNDQKVSEENLDESVEEMDMELDEIPITTNIIERNALLDVNIVNASTEIKDSIKGVRQSTKKIKPRKVKRKKARFTKKKSKVSTNTKRLCSNDNINELKDRPENTEISLDSAPKINQFNSTAEGNILKSINFEFDKKCNPNIGTDINTECVGVNKDKEEGTEIEENLDNKNTQNIGEVNDLFAISASDIVTEKPFLRIKKSLTKRKGKSKTNRKKIIINFCKNKNIIENNREYSRVKEEMSQLLNKQSVNNNVLSPKETKNKLDVNEIEHSSVDGNKILYNFLETNQSDTQTIQVENNSEFCRKLRRPKVSNEISSKSNPKKLHSDDLNRKIRVCESIEELHKIQPLLESTSTPIKISPYSLIPSSPLKEEDPENIYTFNENEEFEIEKPIEISRRLPRKKSASLSEPFEKLQKNNLSESSKEMNETQITKTRLPRRKGTSLSEPVELLQKNLFETSNEVDDFPEKFNREKIITSSEFEHATATETINDFCSTISIKSILLEDLSELKTNKVVDDDTINLKVQEENVHEKKSNLKSEVILEIKANLEDNARRKSMRSAKVKALEHIHDEALAELTESQINRELNRSKTDSHEEIDITTNGKKILNKKTKKNLKVPKLLETLDFDNKVLAEDKPPSFADLVADLAGLEELENSIERELNAADDNLLCNEQHDSEFSIKSHSQENIGIWDTSEQDSQELRRSRRGSRKITSYNENDLIDPIIDIVDRKKNNRKKDLYDNVSQDEVKSKKTKEDVKKPNCDELFDLLKSSENEKSQSSTTQNLFTTSINKIQENSRVADKHEDLFDKVPDLTFQISNEKLSDKNYSRDPEKIYEFTEYPENSDEISFSHIGGKRKSNKSFTSKNYSTDKTLSGDNDNSTSCASFQETASLENSTIDTKSSKTEVKESNYCEICNKSFIRIENLIKHKRTLTHIQKLSEIEAKQAEERSKLHQKTTQDDIKLISEESAITFESSLSDINIQNILLKSEKPNEAMSQIVHSSFPNNDSLKLVDIISDVLNKPSLVSADEDSNFIDSQNQSDIQPELRRYKSLGERKSFDSDNVLTTTDHNSISISETYLSKTTILEKQISLLENIIENQAGVSYIDDISMSSNNSAVDNARFNSKKDDSNNLLSKEKSVALNNMENSFLKPNQYEEISEDSVNIRNYEDQKLRKTLNRDEELFLECCSLLKSGSEVSSYSNQRSQKVMNRLEMKRFDEPESLEDTRLRREPDYGFENDYFDGNSRIPTPLGDSYDDDASDSNTISSNWDINKMEPVFDDNPNVTSNLNFQEVLNKAINQEKVEIMGNFRKCQENEDADNISNDKKKEEISENSTNKKKIITKGARKVFEGLKVSIPTEEINLEEVLNCSPKCKKVELQLLQSTSDEQSVSESMSSPQKPSRNARKSKPVKKAQVGSNLLFKVKKKKTVSSPGNTSQEKDNTKSIDVYDFEETQDNSDVFPKPDFRAFRSKKFNENTVELESDTESRDDYLESFIGQPDSVTSSLSSSSSMRKSKAQESITKKKCMIMGRIFKNQAKSKIEDIDEEMREIPVIDNDELVENYVANCKIIKNAMKPKLSETEINQLFDQLLENKDSDKNDNSDTLVKSTSKLKPENMKEKEKKLLENKKKKIKNRKRARMNSESTDDEFNLNKSTKRIYRKNGKAEDNSINLEQELKECIGVASRKSQRKCTSGKQNVLVEYWSSDESQFEALLESQRIEHKSKQIPKASEIKEVKPPECSPEEKHISIIKSDKEFEKIPTILKPPPRPKAFKKTQTKRKHTADKDKTINLNVTINSSKTTDPAGVNRRKRAAANPLYHWSSSSEDESQDLIEIKPLREDDEEFEDDRPIQHGWIVGESPKKLVTMLAQAKGKKLIDVDCVKEQGKKRTNNSNS